MKEYIIYHIPGVKIGCTSELKTRLRNQKFTKYEILERHSDIYIASDREIELQKQYGYRIDSIPYWKTLIAQKEIPIEARAKGGSRGGRAHVISGHLSKITKLAHQANRKPIIQFDKDGNKIKEWSCANEAGRILEIKTPNIVQVLKGRRKSAGGYTFQYKE